MKIKWILHKFYSKRDQAGNCYWAFNLTDTESDKTVSGTISGGESNLDGVIYCLSGNEWKSNYYSSTQEMPIRQFNRITKDYSYLGCKSAEIAKKCLELLAK